MGAYIRGGLIYGERINGVLQYVQNVHCFTDIKTICVTNEKLIKFWWRKFHKPFNKILQIYNMYTTIILLYIYKKNRCRHNSERLANEKKIENI